MIICSNHILLCGLPSPFHCCVLTTHRSLERFEILKKVRVRPMWYHVEPLWSTAVDVSGLHFTLAYTAPSYTLHHRTTAPACTSTRHVSKRRKQPRWTRRAPSPVDGLEASPYHRSSSAGVRIRSSACFSRRQSVSLLRYRTPRILREYADARACVTEATEGLWRFVEYHEGRGKEGRSDDRKVSPARPL